jgi:hypothetical protein
MVQVCLSIMPRLHARHRFQCTAQMSITSIWCGWANLFEFKSQRH